MEAHNRQEIEEKIQCNNPSLEQARVAYSGWLKRNLGEKRASTLVVEFEREEDADHAILNGIVLGAQIFACEYYDRACKAKQCFRCQKYGHIGTHCKAQETCGYCAENHSTKECTQRDKPGSGPTCPNCRQNHPSWSIQCENRKEEFARIEERRRNLPRTHKEAALKWGNYTGKPTYSNETPKATRQEPRTILRASGTQRRGISPRKSLRQNTEQGNGEATRKALQEIDRNILSTPLPSTANRKRRALENPENENEPTVSQDSVMSIIPLNE